MKFKKAKIFISAVLLAFLADQISKLLIFRLLHNGKIISIIGDYLRLILRFNPYNIFGLRLIPPKFTPILILIAIGVIIYFAIKDGNKAHLFFYGLILGGALGNFLDRMRLGYVIDFIDIGINSELRWPTFNLADVAINIGIFGVLIFTVFTNRGKGRNQK